MSDKTFRTLLAERAAAVKTGSLERVAHIDRALRDLASRAEVPARRGSRR